MKNNKATDNLNINQQPHYELFSVLLKCQLSFYSHMEKHLYDSIILLTSTGTYNYFNSATFCCNVCIMSGKRAGVYIYEKIQLTF
jgi:hypothetical protein